jgi:hypothetical protein
VIPARLGGRRIDEEEVLNVDRMVALGERAVVLRLVLLVEHIRLTLSTEAIVAQLACARRRLVGFCSPATMLSCMNDAALMSYAAVTMCHHPSKDTRTLVACVRHLQDCREDTPGGHAGRAHRPGGHTGRAHRTGGHAGRAGGHSRRESTPGGHTGRARGAGGHSGREDTPGGHAGRAHRPGGHTGIFEHEYTSKLRRIKHVFLNTTEYKQDTNGIRLDTILRENDTTFT